MLFHFVGVEHRAHRQRDLGGAAQRIAPAADLRRQRRRIAGVAPGLRRGRLSKTSMATGQPSGAQSRP
jgi:hypothetical protein